MFKLNKPYCMIKALIIAKFFLAENHQQEILAPRICNSFISKMCIYCILSALELDPL